MQLCARATDTFYLPKTIYTLEVFFKQEVQTTMWKLFKVKEQRQWVGPEVELT